MSEIEFEIPDTPDELLALQGRQAITDFLANLDETDETNPVVGFALFLTPQQALAVATLIAHTVVVHPATLHVSSPGNDLIDVLNALESVGVEWHESSTEALLAESGAVIFDPYPEALDAVVQETIDSLVADGLVETEVIDGETVYRLTDAGNAKAEEIITQSLFGGLE